MQKQKPLFHAEQNINSLKIEPRNSSSRKNSPEIAQAEDTVSIAEFNNLKNKLKRHETLFNDIQNRQIQFEKSQQETLNKILDVITKFEQTSDSQASAQVNPHPVPTKIPNTNIHFYPT